MDPRDTLEQRRAEVARAKRRVLLAARADRPTIEGVVRHPLPTLPSVIGAVARNPGVAASVAVAVVCVLGLGGTAALASRALKLVGVIATARRLLKD